MPRLSACLSHQMTGCRSSASAVRYACRMTTPSGGTLARASDALLLLLSWGAFALALAACSSKPPLDPGNGSSGGGGQSGLGGTSGVFYEGCPEDGFSCNGNVAVPCAADLAAEARDCAAEGASCRAPHGCVVCTPGEGSCSDGSARVCNAEGTAFVEFECDPLQGMECQPEGCTGACSLAELGSSYVGCDYYPTVTANPVFSGFHFAVAVANTGSGVANVRVTRAAEAIASVEVPAGELRMIELPWVAELKGGDQDSCQRPPALGATRLVEDGAYRLRSDRPVSVYQFNPLEYELSPIPDACPLRSECPGSPPRDEGCLSFSNDASLLFPANVLTGSYGVLSWPSTAAGAGFISIVGTRPGTRVTVRGRGRFLAGAGISADGAGEVTLGQGDVLQLLAEPSATQSFGSDLSGTTIEASLPVQVIGGSSCGFVPEATTLACDHLEHAMLPAETLGRDYLVSFPAAPASQSPHVVRVLAVAQDTTLQFTPELPGVGGSLTISPDAGPLDLGSVTGDFRVTADSPIMVAQYLQGQSSVDSGAGDPSMAVVVPRAQYRDNYIFSVSRTYDFNFVNVVAPSDATVLLDGEPLPDSAFSAIEGTDHRVARQMLPPDREVFRIEGTRPFGIVVYGYGAFTSYMYPGGLDLKRIAPPIIR